METLIRQELLPYFRVSLHTVQSLSLMTSSLNFPNLYLVCLFNFGKLSTMKHTVASVGLISIQ